MSTKCSNARTFFKVIATILVLSEAVVTISCHDGKIPHKERDPLKDKIAGMDTAKNRWGSWNVLLKDGTNRADASKAILDYENAIIDAMNSNPKFKGYNVNFQVFYCPCDPLLYNIGATLLDGAGYTVTTPPPPPPPGGSGDVLFASNNNHIPDLDDSIPLQGHFPDTSKRFEVVDSTGRINVVSQILAVIDTGLDSIYLPGITNLLRRQTMYNVAGGNVNSLFDDHPRKHGTVVAALALQAVKDQNARFQNAAHPLPSLIILKALNDQKQGSTFSVSCALSYAIQHKAAVINASLGYYDYNGLTDSVFRHYIEKTKDNSIPLFAAAGNLPAVKIDDSICHAAHIDNLLGDRRMFYPACFSVDFTNVYTVTGLTEQPASCFYQNYSSTYVSLGVRQTTSGLCCHFRVPFASGEGTSFATPVACGTALSFVLNGHPINDFISSLNTDPSLSNVTKAGQYMNYSSK